MRIIRAVVVVCSIVIIVACGQSPQQDQVALSPTLSHEPARADAPPTFVSEPTRPYSPPSDATRPAAMYPPPIAPEGYPAYATNPPVADTITLPPESTPLPFPSPDFGFVFTYGSCLTNRMDTFAYTYTKDLGNGAVVTLTLILSTVEMERIYQQILAIKYFDYPSHYVVLPTSNEEVMTVIPAPAYAFEVQNNGKRKSVEWVDSIVRPNPQEAENLRALANLMSSIIEAQPAVRVLPHPTIGCA